MNRFYYSVDLFWPLLSQPKHVLFLLQFFGEMVIQPIFSQVRSQQDGIHDGLPVRRTVANDAIAVDPQERSSSNFGIVNPLFKAADGPPHEKICRLCPDIILRLP